MESICATHIVIRYRYASEEQDEGPEKHDALSTIWIHLSNRYKLHENVLFRWASQVRSKMNDMS